MTRETKLGLAVATSFLSLVGGVLGVKLYRGELGDAPQPTVVAEAGPKQPAVPTPENPAEQPVSDAAKAEVERNRLPATKPGETTPIQVVSNPPAAVPPPAEKPDPPAESLMKSSSPPVAVVPPPPALDAKKDEAAPPPPSPIVVQPLPAMTEPKKEESPAPAPASAPAPVIVPPPPIMTEPKKEEQSPPPPAMAEPKKDDAPPPPAPAPLTPLPPAPVMTDPKKDDPPAPAPLTPPPPPVMTEPKKDDPPKSFTFDKPADATNLTPPPPPARALPPMPEPPPTTTPPAPLNPDINKKAEPTVTVIPATAADLAAGNRPRDPFVAPTPRPAPEPKTQSYLEEEHRWQPADSFRAVSERYYFSPKYDAALRQYNRDYPLAAKAMKQNAATLPPGTTVWVPPVRILERDYPELIGALAPAPGIAPIQPTSRPGTLVSPAPPPSGAGSPLYRVRGGETLYEIARRTLNASDQWFQIHRLNPTLSQDPKLPIPTGTILRMPANAKVDSADKP